MDRPEDGRWRSCWGQIVYICQGISIVCGWRSPDPPSTPPGEELHQYGPSPQAQFSGSFSSSSHALTTPSTLEIIRPQPPAKYLIPASGSKSGKMHSSSSQDTNEQVQSPWSYNPSFGSESRQLQELTSPQAQPQSSVAKTGGAFPFSEESQSWRYFIPVYAYDRTQSEPLLKDVFPSEDFTRPVPRSLQELLTIERVFFEEGKLLKKRPVCLIKAAELTETLRWTMRRPSVSTSESASTSESTSSSNSGLSLRLTVSLEQSPDSIGEVVAQEDAFQADDAAPWIYSPPNSASSSNETSSAEIELSNVLKNLLLNALSSQVSIVSSEVGENEPLKPSSKEPKVKHDSTASINSDQPSLEEDPPSRQASLPSSSKNPLQERTEQNPYGEGPSGIISLFKRSTGFYSTKSSSSPSTSSSSILTPSPLSSPSKKNRLGRKVKPSAGQVQRIPRDDLVVPPKPKAILDLQGEGKTDNVHPHTLNEGKESGGDIVYIDILLERAQPEQPNQELVNRPVNIPVIQERQDSSKPPINLAQLSRLVPLILYADLIVERRQPEQPGQSQPSNMPPVAPAEDRGRENPTGQPPYVAQLRQLDQFALDLEARAANIQQPANISPPVNVPQPAHINQPANIQQPADRHQPANVNLPVNINPPPNMYPLGNMYPPAHIYPPYVPAVQRIWNLPRLVPRRLPRPPVLPRMPTNERVRLLPLNGSTNEEDEVFEDI